MCRLFYFYDLPIAVCSDLLIAVICLLLRFAYCCDLPIAAICLLLRFAYCCDLPIADSNYHSGNCQSHPLPLCLKQFCRCCLQKYFAVLMLQGMLLKRRCPIPLSQIPAAMEDGLLQLHPATHLALYQVIRPVFQILCFCICSTVF